MSKTTIVIQTIKRPLCPKCASSKVWSHGKSWKCGNCNKTWRKILKKKGYPRRGKMQPCTCGCGTLVYVEPSKIGTRKFLNRRHYQTWLSKAKTRVGKQNPNWKHGRMRTTDSSGNFSREQRRLVYRRYLRDLRGNPYGLRDDEVLWDSTKKRKYSPKTPKKIRIPKVTFNCTICGKKCEERASRARLIKTCGKNKCVKAYAKLRSSRRVRDSKGRYI